MNDIHISVLFADSVWCTCVDGNVDKCDLILVCMDDGAQRRFISVTCIDGQLTACRKKELHKFCEDLLQKYEFTSCSDCQPEVSPPHTRAKASAATGVAPPDVRSRTVMTDVPTPQRPRHAPTAALGRAPDSPPDVRPRTPEPDAATARGCACASPPAVRSRTVREDATTAQDAPSPRRTCHAPTAALGHAPPSPPDVRSHTLERRTTRAVARRVAEEEAAAAFDTDQLSSSDDELLGPATHAAARERARRRAQAVYGATSYLADKHGDNVADDNLDDENVTTYACGQCDAVKGSKPELRAHIYKRHKGYLCMAPHCMAVCNSERHQRQHYSVRHQSGDYSCTDCGKKFVHLSKLREHVITHEETPVMYKCDCAGCSSEFSHQRDLRRHMEKHDSKEHVCPDCGDKFKEKRHLV